jgi:hypothetical protein
MICISRKQYKISFIDIIDDGIYTVKPNVFQRSSTSNDNRPQAFVLDQKKQLVIAFTISEIQSTESP